MMTAALGNREHCYFRIILDETTVEGAAKTMFELSDTDHLNEYVWEYILPEAQDYWRTRAGAVLAAAVEAQHDNG